jgi:hypothetical protein
MRARHDLVVIERELGEIVEREPADAHRVGRRADPVIAELGERVVRHGDDALARIAAERAERVELLEVHVLDPGLLLELALRGLVDRLAEPHEPAGQRPRVLERRQLALDQQHLQIGLVEAEHHAVHRQRRAGILVRVAHARSAFPAAT